jgi:hypothetical protein
MSISVDTLKEILNTWPSTDDDGNQSIVRIGNSFSRFYGTTYCAKEICAFTSDKSFDLLILPDNANPNIYSDIINASFADLVLKLLTYEMQMAKYDDFDIDQIEQYENLRQAVYDAAVAIRTFPI